jgi:hypothetical protein
LKRQRLEPTDVIPPSPDFSRRRDPATAIPDFGAWLDITNRADPRLFIGSQLDRDDLPHLVQTAFRAGPLTPTRAAARHTLRDIVLTNLGDDEPPFAPLADVLTDLRRQVKPTAKPVDWRTVQAWWREDHAPAGVL